MYGHFTRIPSILRRTIAGIGGAVPECVIQWIVYEKPIYNSTTSKWEYRDKAGSRDGVLNSNVGTFNGTTNYISDLVPLYTSTPDVILELDFKKYGTSDNTAIYSEGHSGTNTGFFFITPQSNGTIAVSLYNDSGLGLIVGKSSNTTGLNDGNKHTLKWIDNNGTVELWIDGVKDTSDFSYTPSGTITYDTASIGALTRTNTIYEFQGTIANLKQSRTDGTLLHWYKLDEADGTVIYDSVVGGINGTANNIDVNTFWIQDIDFTSFQNEVGYSGGGIGENVSVFENFISLATLPDYATFDNDLITWHYESGGSMDIKQSSILEIGKQYQFAYEILSRVGNPGLRNSGSGGGVLDTSLGKHTQIFTATNEAFFITRESITKLGDLVIGGILIQEYIPSTTLIPAQVDSTGKLTGKDALGNSLGHKGRVRYNPTVVNSNVYEFDGTAYLAFTDLSGITITSSTGTTTPTINGNNINFTAGTLSYLELSNGSKYNCAEGGSTTAYDVINTLHGAITNANLATFHTTAIVRPDNLLDGFSQKFVCESSGTTSIPSNVAYGEWEFFIKIGNANNLVTVSFINENINPRFTNIGYMLMFLESTGSIRFYAVNGATGNILFESLANYVLKDVRYKIKISRKISGEFTIYIKGGIHGDNYILVDASGEGTNPIIDNTYTTSNYFGIDNDAGDELKNLSINSVTQNLMAATDGTGTYSKVRVPASTSTLDAEGDALSNPSGKWHNNAESKILQPYANQIWEVDDSLATNFWYTSLGVSVAKSYADFAAQDGNLENKIMWNNLISNQYNNIVTLEINSSAACLTAVRKKIGLGVWYDNQTWQDQEAWSD